jgi:glycosyltransferase involved in cell wall biosynthesis
VFLAIVNSSSRMSKAKICYISSSYRSYSRAARSYRRVIQDRYDLVRSPEDAEVVILHGCPDGIGDIYRRHPSLRKKYVIGYFVWEASDLPDSYKTSLSSMQEVWTCSQYCVDVFRRHHPNVQLIPHIIDRDISCPAEDLAFVMRMIDWDPSCRYFLSIASRVDRRKNIDAVIRVFHDLGALMPRARLVVRVDDEAKVLPSFGDKRIVALSSSLSDSAINGLYLLSDAYVSAHHAEGWGFTLSDAMVFEKPVVGTGYSGNLEFMNARNSLLLDFEESFIRPEDCSYPFREAMKWAYPSIADLEQKLLLIYEGAKSPDVLAMATRAKMEMRRFEQRAVGRLVTGRLQEILDSRTLAVKD